MPQLYDFINQLAPKMAEWRRDFHLHAESRLVGVPHRQRKWRRYVTIWVISWRWVATLSMPIAVWAYLMKRPGQAFQRARAQVPGTLAAGV